MSRTYSHIHLQHDDTISKEEIKSEYGKSIIITVGNASLFFNNSTFEQFKKMINEPFKKGMRMNQQEIMIKLQAPFLPNEIEWRVGSTNKEKTKGLALAYVTNRAIQNRLDEIFGPFGWKNEYKEWKGNSQICGISVKFESEWITKWDGADDSNTEATKGGLSDAMKRAGYQWGIGRYLYNLPQSWVSIKSFGKSYALAEIPKLPKWALPGEYEYKNQSKQEINNEKSENKSNIELTKNLICINCDKEITQKIKSFSENKFGKSLCMNCQKKEGGN